jgi:Rps23 Pro-64 3,4-dihydroxylase Tpa1-like proline 4-hydroxylase
MTPKQILDSFSETLMADERILSAQERALLTSLVQHTNNASATNQQTQEAVRLVINSAVGEIVGQRAFAVLGGSIVERILQGTATAVTDTPEIHATDPQPPTPKGPGPGPTVKAPHKEPHHPHHPQRTPSDPQPPTPKPAPMKDPQPPTPKGPTGVVTTVVSRTSTAVADRPEKLAANCVVLDEFLAPQELDDLIRFTLEHESDFEVSEVLSPRSENGVVNYDHRRSRVLMDVGRHQDVILERIQSALPEILENLGMEEFDITGVEVQITASNDGDFFHFHSDNSSERVANRNLTFVYFFQREPQQFEGGELRIHDAHLEGGTYVSDGSYQTIVPQQNQIVFFPCELLHEITPVKCSSGRFADSRFTVNGWLRR